MKIAYVVILWKILGYKINGQNPNVFCKHIHKAKKYTIHHTDLSTVDSGINYFPFQHYVIRNDLWVDVT